MMVHNHNLCRKCRRGQDNMHKTNKDNSGANNEVKQNKGWLTLGGRVNPYHVAMGCGAATAVVCAAPMLVGFGTGGIVAGSLAAAWQATIGNVAAGSAFATLQSLGATGTLATGAYGGAGVLGLGALGNRLVGKSDKKTNEHDDADSDDRVESDNNGDNDHAKDHVTGDHRQICASCGAFFTADDYDDADRLAQ